MSGRLQDKVSIVTGASSGIGRAICFAYAAEGSKVVCADLREISHFDTHAEEAAGTTHDLINKNHGDGRAKFIRCDVTKAAEVEELVKEAATWGGRVDVMVNNAGISLEGRDPRPVWDCPVETWETTNAINSSGVFFGTKYASAQMVKQEPHSSGDRGWIINTASVLGLVGDWHCAAYSASKGAVVNFTRAAAIDCGPMRIHVNCICPGYTASAMTLPLFSQPDVRKMLLDRHPFAERLGEPEDLARACVFLASEDARWVSGVALPVDGGFTAR